MNRIALGRLVIGATGLGLVAVGAVHLARSLHTVPQVTAVGGRWLAGPVVLDLALVPLVAVVAVLLRRRLSDRWFRPVAGAAGVSLLVTIVALPFLSGVGRRPDNTTLLDRPYTVGWLGILAGIWCVALIQGLRRSS